MAQTGTAGPAGAQMTATLLSLAMLERLDRVIWTVRQAGEGARPGALADYSAIVLWASDVAPRCGTVPQWQHAMRDALHEQANAGELAVAELSPAAWTVLRETLAAAQGVVTYTPTPSTAIAWLLEVAALAGHCVPGEEAG